MKVGIYREFSDGASALGGAEYSVAALAEGLESDHEVEIIHDNPAFTHERVQQFFGIDLRRVRFRVEKGKPLYSLHGVCRSRTPWGMYREVANWQAELSRPYDLFICVGHFLPPLCHAPHGVLLVLFPTVDRFTDWPWSESGSGSRLSLVKAVRNATYDWVWRAIFRSYKHRFAISEFTRSWTKRRWGVDCEVLYPPVDIRGETSAKQPVIATIGRFQPQKKQRELVEKFLGMVGEGLPEWSLLCAGGLADVDEDRRYFDGLRSLAGTAPVELVANASREDLLARLASASIFWHAMGLGLEESTDPFAMEHFGIVTVEAMARGCVPVVINRGGQPEIVRHGIDGFLWETLEELDHYTRLLVNDDALRYQMSESSRVRALKFEKAQFIRDFVRACRIPMNGSESA